MWKNVWSLCKNSIKNPLPILLFVLIYSLFVFWLYVWHNPDYVSKLDMNGTLLYGSLLVLHAIIFDKLIREHKNEKRQRGLLLLIHLCNIMLVIFMNWVMHIEFTTLFNCINISLLYFICGLDLSRKSIKVMMNVSNEKVYEFIDNSFIDRFYYIVVLFFSGLLGYGTYKIFIQLSSLT